MINLIDIQYVKITAQYSNAVLLAILPHISNFVEKMELPVPQPITVQQVEAFGCDEHLGETGGSVRLQNGYIFTFQHGHVRGFKTPNRYYGLQDPRLVPRFYGELKMTADEAAQLCRSTIRQIGYTEEMLYADLEPKFELPQHLGTNIVPRYLVKWEDPRDGTPSCEFEVNGQDRRIESIWFLNRNLWRPPPKIDVPPVPKVGKVFRSRFQPVNREYARRLLSAILPEISEYGQRLGLPIPRNLSTNQVKSYVCQKFDGVTYAETTLTNGYHFFYRYGTVQGFDAPDCFFNFPAAGVKVKDFIGTRKITELQSIELAKTALKKLGYSEKELFADEKPDINRPHGVFNVPRVQISWSKGTNGVQLSKTLIEFDLEHSKIKSCYILNPRLFRPMPDLGISEDTN